MAECTASVRIADRAGDRAGDELEQDQQAAAATIESRATARACSGRGPLVRRSAAAQRVASHASSAARGAAAVADRVLLGVGELGHRAAAVAVVGHERPGRSRSRRSPRGSAASVPVAAALEEALLAGSGST